MCYIKKIVEIDILQANIITKPISLCNKTIIFTNRNVLREQPRQSHSTTYTSHMTFCMALARVASGRAANRIFEITPGQLWNNPRCREKNPGCKNITCNEYIRFYLFHICIFFELKLLFLHSYTDCDRFIVFAMPLHSFQISSTNSSIFHILDQCSFRIPARTIIHTISGDKLFCQESVPDSISF